MQRTPIYSSPLQWCQLLCILGQHALPRLTQNDLSLLIYWHDTLLCLNVGQWDEERCLKPSRLHNFNLKTHEHTRERSMKHYIAQYTTNSSLDLTAVFCHNEKSLYAIQCYLKYMVLCFIQSQKVMWHTCSPLALKCLGWSDHKWTALKTGVNAPAMNWRRIKIQMYLNASWPTNSLRSLSHSKDFSPMC